MRTRSAALLVILVLTTVAGCTGTAPSPARSTATHSAAATAVTPSPSLTAAAQFYEQQVCQGAVAAYDGMQTALGGTSVASVRAAGTKGADLYSTELAKIEAYPWSAAVKAVLPPYTAKARQQIAYYRAEAKAKSVAAAVDLQFPEGTDAIVTPVESTLGLPADWACAG